MDFFIIFFFFFGFDFALTNLLIGVTFDLFTSLSVYPFFKGSFFVLFFQIDFSLMFQYKTIHIQGIYCCNKLIKFPPPKKIKKSIEKSLKLVNILTCQSLFDVFEH